MGTGQPSSVISGRLPVCLPRMLHNRFYLEPLNYLGTLVPIYICRILTHFLYISRLDQDTIVTTVQPYFRIYHTCQSRIAGR